MPPEKTNEDCISRQRLADDKFTLIPTLPQLSGRILAVEDDPVNRKLLLMMLKRLGLDVAIAENGQHCIDAIMRGDVPDLVLMDIRMPVMNGDVAAARIRQWESENGRPRLPIIAVTAERSDAIQQRCLVAGMDKVMTKPIDLQDLAATLGHWLPPAPEQNRGAG